MRSYIFWHWMLLGCVGSTAAAVDYEREIKPLLRERCFACHGALKQKADLRLDTVAAMRLGGADGDVLAGVQAVLLDRVTTEDVDERMPPEGEGAAFSADQVALLKQWIAEGATGPLDEQAEPDPRLHWAYHRPESAKLSVDELLAVQRAKHGVVPQSAAAPGIWLRRVYLDLIGLPPGVEEIQVFEQRMAKAADPLVVRREVVEKLLASPQYGERWGRHFMDIWRYSDWYGLGAQMRYSHKHLWHWRDWIVESLNADKGYDQMVQQMLAADELDPTDTANLRATGFLARSYYLFNRTTWLDATIEHTSRAFLGLTMQCVKCHDHKYDPVDHAEYYRMRAVFEPMHVRLDAVPGVTDFEKDGLPRVFDLHVERPTYRHVRGDEAQEDQSKAHAPGVPSVLSWEEFLVEPVKLPLETYRPAAREQVLKDHWAKAVSDLEAAGKGLNLARQQRDQLQSASESGEEQKAPRVIWKDAFSEGKLTIDEARCEVERAELAVRVAESNGRRVRAAHAAESAPGDEGLARRAAQVEAEHDEVAARVAVMKAEQGLASVGVDAKQKAAAEKQHKEAQDALAKATARVKAPGAEYRPLRAVLKAQEGPAEADNASKQRFPQESTGRRLAFARWVTDSRHPLTARVLVNQVWLRHFGASLVEDVTDFGRRTKPPIQRALLDTLAVRFMEKGWSLKALHREMVLTDLYAMRSSQAGADAATVAADPDNQLYWRMNARRMESQVVRDSLLHLAGQLDLVMGGPTVDPVKGESTTRRALYFNQTAFDQHRFLGGFDNANVLECYRREVSVMPQQALALSNSRESADCAALLAKSWAGCTDEELVERAFLAILGREPLPSEREVCLAALTQMNRGLFLQGLLNHNDFITVR